MSGKTVVLGSGISALTYLYMNEHARALAGSTAGLGGMFKNQKNLGPQYLWADKFSEEFLKMLYLPAKTRTVNVGIHYNKILYGPLNKIAPVLQAKIAAEYAAKTRGTTIKKSFMSSGSRRYEVFTTSMEVIVNTLLARVQRRLTPVVAIEIDTEHNFVQDNYGDRWSYDKLVSTIPAPDFLRMSGQDFSELKALDKLYGLLPVSKCLPWIQEAYKQKLDYVYCPGHGEPWHRVTFTNIGSEAFTVLEFTDIKVDSFHGIALADFFVSTILQKQGQIVSGKEVLKASAPKNAMFLGRYAQWDHSVKFNDVLRRVIEN